MNNEGEPRDNWLPNDMKYGLPPMRAQDKNISVCKSHTFANIANMQQIFAQGEVSLISLGCFMFIELINSNKLFINKNVEIVVFNLTRIFEFIVVLTTNYNKKRTLNTVVSASQ